MDATQTKTATIYALTEHNRDFFSSFVKETIPETATHIAVNADSYFLMEGDEFADLRSQMGFHQILLPRFVFTAAYDIEYYD